MCHDQMLLSEWIAMTEPVRPKIIPLRNTILFTLLQALALLATTVEAFQVPLLCTSILSFWFLSASMV
jgi:hypothetical protein